MIISVGENQGEEKCRVGSKRILTLRLLKLLVSDTAQKTRARKIVLDCPAVENLTSDVINDLENQLCRRVQILASQNIDMYFI